MATTTSLLGLTKPAASEAADISVLNGNFDLIDAFIKGTGLGRGACGIDSLDNATTFGLYSSNVGVPPIEGKVYWVTLVMPHNTTQTMMQIAYRATSNPTSYATRRMTDGVWGEWEYINPPMYEGVEYRTTERSGGKPVYKKRIVHTSTGIEAASTVTNYNIAHGISGFGEMVSVTAKVGSYPLPYLDTSGNLTTVAGVTSANINLRMQAGWSGERTWTIDLAYTKA